MNTTVYFGIAVTAILIILGIIFSKSRTVSFGQILWIALLTAGNSGGTDFIDNMNIYLAANTHQIGGLSVTNGVFSLFATIAREHGMQYITFNAMVSAVSTALVALFVFKFAKRPALAFSLILIFPLIDNVIQKRWYPAMAIVLVALPLLLDKQHKIRNIIMFWFFCLIAVQFHSGALVYLTIPLFLLIPEKLQFKVAVFAFVGGSLLPSLFPILLKYITIQGMTDKLNLYFTTFAQTASIWHYLFWILWQSLQIWLVYIMHKMDSNNLFLNFAWKLNMWSIIFIPLNYFNPVFTRIYRLIMIINFVAVGNALKLQDGKKISLGSIIAFGGEFVMATASFLLMDFLTASSLGFDILVIPVYVQNIFLN